MRLRLVAVGTRMPGWVTDGFREYARRLPHDNRLELVEVAPADRRKGEGPARWRELEAARLLDTTGGATRRVSLDRDGRALTTPQLASRLEDWRMDGRDVDLLVGGPDGLADRVLRAADESWCLSPLTLPHALVRVVVAEALYRAWSVLAGHPYHR